MTKRKSSRQSLMDFMPASWKWWPRDAVRCGLCVSGGLLGTLVGCYRAPVTGREQMIFFSEETEMSMGLSAYREVLREFPLSTNPETNAMIRRVGERVAAVANQPAYEWEFAVIQDDKIANASRLPGGTLAFCPRIL